MIHCYDYQNYHFLPLEFEESKLSPEKLELEELVSPEDSEFPELDELEFELDELDSEEFSPEPLV